MTCVGQVGNPAFDKQEPPIETAILYLNCINDISGKSPRECEYPLCTINKVTFDEDDVLTSTTACTSCEVLLTPENVIFAYDCTNVFPSMECPVRYFIGSCSDSSNTFAPPTTALQGIRPDSAEILDRAAEQHVSLTETNDDNDSKSSWILDMDPTLFNVISDLVACVTRFAMGVSMTS